ncbi:unnamed protein product [Phytophthora fragariaefolia]|uniref:Unnamed protein product n=1 Tax=Phytophthora fragariaefolia TaxID=1490495 RepID=A0A9W6XLR1_9STRA|nr:unnamed protein product [Phytophthora fragariaefolia]
MPDVKMEIFRKTRELFGQDSPTSALEKAAKTDGKISASGSAPPSGRGAVVPVTSRRFGVFRRLRGHILYHLFPHDKTIWKSFKDPWWVAYTSVGLLPVAGQLWWILLFIIKDKTNEHQLCQFIVGFKAAQFITLGIMHMMFGIFMYVKCIVQGSMLACQNGNGPALSEGTACFFVFQIVLVWAAFFRLPYTERPQELYRTKSMELRERRVFHDAFGNEVHLNRGGYLMKFCGYETVSFTIIMALAGLVLWLPFESWQRQALFYWVRTAYGLFSFPFLVFKIPVLANVLMHTRQMGYNEHGETVRFVAKKRHETKTSRNTIVAATMHQHIPPSEPDLSQFTSQIGQGLTSRRSEQDVLLTEPPPKDLEPIGRDLLGEKHVPAEAHDDAHQQLNRVEEHPAATQPTTTPPSQPPIASAIAAPLQRRCTYSRKAKTPTVSSK